MLIWQAYAINLSEKMKLMSKLSIGSGVLLLGLVVSSYAAPAHSPVKPKQVVVQANSAQAGMQQALNDIQQQIQDVANRVPKQLSQQQAETDKKILVLQKQTQKELKILHQQIQQVQNQMQKNIAKVQQEVQQLELIK